MLHIFKEKRMSSIKEKRFKHLHIFLSIAIAIGLFIVLVSSLVYIKQPEGYVLGGEWGVIHNGETETVSLPCSKTISKEGVYTYKKTFGSVDADTLVIPNILAYGYQITLNGIMIKKLNYEENKTANIWNQTQMVVFDRKLLKEQNTLEITMYSIFDHGMSYLPYLVDQKDILAKIAISNYLENDVYLFSIGASITLGFVLFALGLGIPEKKGFHYSFAFGTIFIGIYLLDYQFRVYTCDQATYIYFRKIIFSSLYMSGLMLLQGVEYYLYGKKKYSRIFTWLIPFLIIGFLFMPDFNAIKIYNNYALLVMFIMILLVAVQIYIKRDKAFMFAATILTLCMINDVIKVFFSLNHIHMIRFGIIITVLSMGFLLVEFFRNTYGNMVIAHGKAMKDPLTGAFNRNILETIETSPQDIMVLVDFDDFKIINDVYGHAEGDRILKMFTGKAVEMLRDTDIIVRIGGDEFMIFMKNCSEETALKRIELIRSAMTDEIEDYDFNFSYGSYNLKNGVSQAFSKADELLYEMKKKKKATECDI